MKLTIARMLTVFAVVVTLGLSASIAFETLTLEKVKVNGPIYADIVDGKDLIADILPRNPKVPFELVNRLLRKQEISQHELWTGSRQGRETAYTSGRRACYQ